MNAVPLSSMTPAAAGDRAGGRRHGVADARRLSRRATDRVVSAVLDRAVDRGGCDRRAVIPNGTVFGSSFIVDDFARFMKILAYAGSAFAIVMSLDYLEAASASRPSNIRS